MPSEGYPVNIPDELRGPPGPEESQVVKATVPLQDLLALVFIVSGTAMVGFGVGRWLDPWAGVAVSGLIILIVGVLLGFNRSNEK